jgi:predicted regulator of Ras-like GTPase activity (Roadblock/LC7/MglB family)
MAKQEELKKHMQALRNAVPELNGLLLASNEGAPIAHSLSNGTDPNNLAATAAAASRMGGKISESMNAGSMCDISVQGEKGAIFFYPAGSGAVLAVICPKGANTGLIHLEARATARKIRNLFEQKTTRDSR